MKNKKTEHANPFVNMFDLETVEMPQPVKFWVDLAALQTRLATSYWEAYFKGFEDIYYANLREWDKGNRENETT